MSTLLHFDAVLREFEREFRKADTRLQPAIHVRDNGDGTMTAREMFKQDGAPFTFAASNYLTAAHRYLANRWPETRFEKTGWSANASEAIYHFSRVGGSA